MSKNIVTYLSDLEASGFSAPRKFVFFDTCVVLDLIRERSHFQPNNVNYFKAYQKLITVIQEQQVFAVSSYMVDTEIRSNYDDRKTEFNSAYNNAINKIKALQALAKYQGNIKRRVNYNDRYRTFTKAEKMYNELYRLITFFEEKIEYDQFAMQHVLHKLIPAHAEHEYKDAFIWGNCLDFKNLTHEEDKIYFFTTNTNDYVINDKISLAERSRLQERLDGECGGKIEIIANIFALEGKLFH